LARSSPVNVQCDLICVNRVNRAHSSCPCVFLMCLAGEDSFVLADIAATSVEQCEARYNEMLERAKRERGSHKTFQAEFITADCSKVPSVS